MTKELRRARRSILQEKPHPKTVKGKRSPRCSCHVQGKFCKKHGKIAIPKEEAMPTSKLPPEPMYECPEDCSVLQFKCENWIDGVECGPLWWLVSGARVPVNTMGKPIMVDVDEAGWFRKDYAQRIADHHGCDLIEV